MLSGKEGYEVEQTINGAWKASFQNPGDQANGIYQRRTD